MAEGHASKKITQLAQEWRGTQRRIENLRSDLSRAEVELHRAEQALAVAIDPGDMKLGEQIAVWVGFGVEDERLVVVKRGDGREKSTDEYLVTLRGKEKR